jgi:hypothetical protein
MASVEERMQILKMIEEGKISATEGAELLRALDKETTAKQVEPLKGSSNPRWFRVRITDLTTGRDKVNVNIPMGLVNVGMKMGARFTPDMGDLQLDEVIEQIRGGAHGKVVDVVDEDEGERVEIFVE